ncbi:TraB/GumN family protein [Sphingomonas sp.]|uniref:TraB/GumN family protein n=1 Tax=Sphingomonas sp. TaxID=28214 RepID=UPI001D86372A|nr:TraB/GumN family protein [Sphingomonas sp.]MBX9797580.1 TraB/GumN family protein [Sphingomonas sp.]
MPHRRIAPLAALIAALLAFAPSVPLAAQDRAPATPAEAPALDPVLAGWTQNYRPRPAIWKISDADTVIYLMGTVHTLPPGFAWQTRALERIVARADMLITEDGDGSTAIDPKLFARNGALPPLARRLPPGYLKRLKGMGFTSAMIAEFDKLPTWLVSASIGMAREEAAGEDHGPGVEDWLVDTFKAAKKPILAIEDGDAVLQRISQLPESEQRAGLIQAIDAPDADIAEGRRGTHGWAKGEMGPDSDLTVEASTGFGQFGEPLLAERNAAWAKVLAARLKQPGTVLFAGGAAHFVGNASVLARLEQLGIEIERIQ